MHICSLLSSYSLWVVLKGFYCSSHSPLYSFQPVARPQDPTVLAAVPRTHHPKGRVTTMQQVLPEAKTAPRVLSDTVSSSVGALLVLKQMR